MDEQPRRQRAPVIMDAKGIYAAAPTVRIPKIDGQMPLLTKGFLTQTQDKSGDVLYLVGCGPDLTAFFDVDTGLLVMQCADCGKYIGAVRVANEG